MARLNPLSKINNLILHGRLNHLLAAGSAALHVLLEGLGDGNVGLLGLGVVGVELGGCGVTSVSLLLATPAAVGEIAGILGRSAVGHAHGGQAAALLTKKKYVSSTVFSLCDVDK